MNENEQHPPQGRRILFTDDMKPGQAEQITKRADALAHKYGQATVLAAVQFCNLTQFVSMMMHPDNTKLTGAERDKALDFGKKAVADTMAILGPAVGACCREHVSECAKALLEEVNVIGEELTGGVDLAKTEGAAKEAIAKASAQES